MEGSHSQRPPAAGASPPDAPDPDAAKPSAEAEIPPSADLPSAELLPADPPSANPPSVDLPSADPPVVDTPAAPEVAPSDEHPLPRDETAEIERVFFDRLEGETTQPVRAFPDTPTVRASALDHSEPPVLPEPDAEPRHAAEAASRDWRDLARRAVSVALLAFAGWFIAVLLLIAAYRFVNPPFSMLMAERWLGGTHIDKSWVPIGSISPNLSRAVIVAEDGRFCSHWGVDFIEAAEAIRRASDGYPRGASTITMQVAKNLFLVPAKSYLRKMVEIPLTFAIELAWPKRRILEVYLNIVEWGPGVFGAEAASHAHFGRPAASLSARQAAQLAAVLPNPILRDAGDPGPRTAHKASIIQARAARTREASSCVDVRR